MTTAAEIREHYAHRIAAAQAAAALRRDLAWVDAPHLVAGAIPLRPMCLPDYLALIVAGNAYVNDLTLPADPAGTDAFWAAHNTQFLWRLSPDYRLNDSAAAARFARRRVAPLPHDLVASDIAEYLADTFTDAPAPVLEAGRVRASPPFPVSFAGAWTHRLATAYGWSRAEIAATPLKEIFQLFRLIDRDREREAGLTPAPLPDETHALRAQMLAALEQLPAA